MSLITPRTLKGFRDHLPESMLQREQLIDKVRSVFQSYGFSPIDTPALEYEEILLGKGGEETDKQIYAFEDHGGRRVGLRFDLTVPLARFSAQHIGALGTPLKRYQIANVWRGENTQKGRYREFAQCDFDTIGTKSMVADIETALVIHDLLVALGCEDFKIHVNNRKILTGLLASLGIEDQTVPILRCLDKLAKVGIKDMTTEMLTIDRVDEAAVASLLTLTEIRGSIADIFKSTRRIVTNNALFTAGLDELEELIHGLIVAGVPESRIHLDLSIARGLDYYTGNIFETFLEALPAIGSVCSGGRYDQLAETYTKTELPGVGASLGIDRLLAAMQEIGVLKPMQMGAEIFVVFFDPDRRDDYIRMTRQLRLAGLRVEMYSDPKKIGQQLKYANRRGHRFALIAGSNELDQGHCQVKDLNTGDADNVSLHDGFGTLVDTLKEKLSAL